MVSISIAFATRFRQAVCRSTDRHRNSDRAISVSPGQELIPPGEILTLFCPVTKFRNQQKSQYPVGRLWHLTLTPLIPDPIDSLTPLIPGGCKRARRDCSSLPWDSPLRGPPSAVLIRSLCRDAQVPRSTGMCGSGPGKLVELSACGAEFLSETGTHENKKGSPVGDPFLFWRARRDSNSRPLPSEGSTLSS